MYPLHRHKEPSQVVSFMYHTFIFVAKCSEKKQTKHEKKPEPHKIHFCSQDSHLHCCAGMNILWQHHKWNCTMPNYTWKWGGIWEGITEVWGQVDPEEDSLELLLRLGHRDGRTLGVIKAVHSAQLHDHMQAVGEDQNHEKTGYQTHPDTRGEETGAVTCIWEVTASHIKALYLNTK